MFQLKVIFFVILFSSTITVLYCTTTALLHRLQVKSRQAESPSESLQFTERILFSAVVVMDRSLIAHSILYNWKDNETVRENNLTYAQSRELTWKGKGLYKYIQLFRMQKNAAELGFCFLYPQRKKTLRNYVKIIVKCRKLRVWNNCIPKNTFYRFGRTSEPDRECRRCLAFPFGCFQCFNDAVEEQLLHAYVRTTYMRT